MKYDKPKNVKFYVNPETRKVVCVIDHVKFSVTDFIRKYTDYWGLMSWETVDEDKFYIPDRFVGIATCSDEDEWNEETGRLIAYKRAREKYDRSFFRAAQRFITYIGEKLNNAVDVINDYGTQMERLYENREKRIEELLKA